MATRVTEGARRERHEKERLFFFSSRSALLVSHVSRLRRSRARALLSLNLKKKRDCSQSTNRIGVHTLPNSFSCRHEELSGSLRASSPIWASEASLARTLRCSLAHSRETRFIRPNRRACSQASYLVECEHYLKVAIEGFHF